MESLALLAILFWRATSIQSACNRLSALHGACDLLPRQAISRTTQQMPVNGEIPLDSAHAGSLTIGQSYVWLLRGESRRDCRAARICQHGSIYCSSSL